MVKDVYLLNKSAMQKLKQTTLAIYVECKRYNFG